MASDSRRHTLVILMASAALLFSAGLHTISLQSLDDAFYARKGVEMHRSGNLYTVTMGGEPTWQNPPLQVWIMGRAFALFGETDGAARLPVVLMALGILLMTVRIGRLAAGAAATSPSIGTAPAGAQRVDAARTSGLGAGVVAAALLVLTPLFSSTARGTMMEIPCVFWVAVAFWCFLEGAGDRAADGPVAARRAWRWHVAMALPIGGAMLTKSVLGLVPIAAIPLAIVSTPELRRRAGVAPWIGLAFGVALGLSWPVQQWWLYGPEALRQHYLGQVLGPSTQAIGLWARLTGYPLILLRSFEPILLPGLIGALGLARVWWSGPPQAWRAFLIVAWIVVPIVAASLSSAQSSRYIFPILPPLALAAAWWLVGVAPRIAAFITQVFTPALACLAAIIFWIDPTHLTRDQNAVFKREGARLQREIPADARLAYIGTRYWAVANPLYFYADRSLDPLRDETALCDDHEAQRTFVIVDRERAARGLTTPCGRTFVTMLEGPDWVLGRVSRR